jgi:hypothetical protein
MKTEKFLVTVKENGVSAIVRRTEKVKDGKKHTYFIVEYVLKGKRKQVWRSDFGQAKATAKDACIKIGNGKAEALELTDRERFIYLRAKETLAPLNVPVGIHPNSPRFTGLHSTRQTATRCLDHTNPAP